LFNAGFLLMPSPPAAAETAHVNLAQILRKHQQNVSFCCFALATRNHVHLSHSLGDSSICPVPHRVCKMLPLFRFLLLTEKERWPSPTRPEAAEIFRKRSPAADWETACRRSETRPIHETEPASRCIVPCGRAAVLIAWPWPTPLRREVVR
jgi:hypothetical protein